MRNGRHAPQARSQRYTSYLLRCWIVAGGVAQPRFVVETVSDPPQQWGFDSVDDLVAFLHAELPLHASAPAGEQGQES